MPTPRSQGDVEPANRPIRPQDDRVYGRDDGSVSAGFDTQNRWTFLIDSTSRGAIEAAMVSLLEPGDKVLVPVFGRFGHLLCEIAERWSCSKCHQHGMGQRILPRCYSTRNKNHTAKDVSHCSGRYFYNHVATLKKSEKSAAKRGYCFIATRLHRLLVTS